MLAHATGGDATPADYKRCRKILVEDTSISGLLPRFVRTCRDPGAFWSFIKSKASGSGSYDARREFLREAFDPLLTTLERADQSPLDHEVTDATVKSDVVV